MWYTGITLPYNHQLSTNSVAECGDSGKLFGNQKTWRRVSGIRLRLAAQLRDHDSILRLADLDLGENPPDSFSGKAHFILDLADAPVGCVSFARARF